MPTFFNTPSPERVAVPPAHTPEPPKETSAPEESDATQAPEAQDTAQLSEVAEPAEAAPMAEPAEAGEATDTAENAEADEASEEENTLAEEAEPIKPSQPTAPADHLTIRGFCALSSERNLARMNKDLGTQLSPSSLMRLQAFYRRNAKREPTVGELRFLDALDREGKEAPDRIAVGEMTTASSEIADTWADMMRKHALLCGVGSTLQGKEAVAAPPCTLPEALALTGHYLRRIRRTAPRPEVLLHTPVQEAVAVAAGYVPVTRTVIGGEVLSVYAKEGKAPDAPPIQNRDLILYFPAAPLEKIRALLAQDRAQKSPAIGDVRAIATRSFLLTLAEICPGATLYADRLPRADGATGQLPIAALCARPSVTEGGVCDFLMRVSAARAQSVTAHIKALKVAARVCGRVSTAEQIVLLPSATADKRTKPMMSFPADFLVSMGSVCPCAMTVGGLAAAEDEAPPQISTEVRRVPATALVMSHSTVILSRTEGTYVAAANTLLTAADALASVGVAPEEMVLTAKLSVSSPDLLRDGWLLETVCGLYRAAAERALPIEDPAITVTPGHTATIRISVTARAKCPPAL